MRNREKSPVGRRQARAVAEALANEAFHNVSFFDGDVERFRAAAKP